MSTVQLAYAISSLMNAVASVEVAFRYLRWWPSARSGGSTLSQLVLGIGVAQTAITIITLVRSVEQMRHPDNIPIDVDSVIILLALGLLLAGTFLHLLPAWQLRGGFHQRHPILAMAWRIGLVMIGVTWLMYWSGYL